MKSAVIHPSACVSEQDVEVERQEVLLKAGALQNAIFKSANFSSIATDARGVIQIFNVGAERMLGYAASEVTNRITPADISDPLEMVARAQALSEELGTVITPGFEALVFKASRGIEDIYELTYIRRDGSRFPAVVSVTALRDANNTIIGFLLIGTDNTARKHAEEALLKAGALQRAIFNSANFSSIATDASGVIQIFNVGAERMLGYLASEVVDRVTPADISDPLEVVARAQALSAELGTAITPGFEALVFKASRGIEDIYELTYIRRDGSRFPAVVSVTALRDASNTIIGYLLIGTDITARKQAEETAQAALMAKSQFLANMSHEIRTPMNAILGLTRMVMESDLKPQQREQLEKVQRSGKALVRIINDILDFSRIEAGRLAIERIPMRVEAVLLEVAELLGMQAEDKGLALHLAIDPAMPPLLMGDPFRLVQILNNLVANAIKFTEQGDIHIGVQVGAAGIGPGAGPMMLHFTVRDTGIGVAPEQIAALFQPFSQVDSSTTRTFGGSGLGLAIVKKLVGLLGGTVRLESTVGQGTSVSFSIEVARAPEELASGMQRSGAVQPMAGKRMLIVDDQPSARHILALLLKAWGIDVMEAGSGAEALAQIEHAQRTAQPFDAMLLDWHMPGMSGLAVVAALRAQEKNSAQADALPIWMVTAHNKPSLQQQPEAALIAGVLTKPISPSLLFEALLQAPPQGGRAAGSGAQEFVGMRVLLVEDNELNQEVAASIIIKRGAILTIAADGAEALELVRHQAFDLVLMDLHMPVMNGLEAARQILLLPHGKQLRIVAMTAAVMVEDRERCQAIGMVDFICKPVEPDDIVRVMRSSGRSRSAVTPERRAVITGAAAARPPVQTPLLDLVQGLRRLDGDQLLQQRLLRGFIDSYQGLMVQLERMFAAGERASVEDLVHAVKGVAANLGAAALAEVSSHLLDQLAAAAPLASLTAFSVTLNATLAQMHSELAGRPAPLFAPLAAAATPSPPSLATLLDLLAPFVKGQELIPDALMDTLDYVSRMDLPEATLLKDLHYCCDNFAHVQALAIFQTLRGQDGQP
ncbi:response regulator [Massilia sp. PWRC2]|uniref:response regulator n=1 Tax=Massilia sp. PWRC2 TaxID=2804626 RepID=UPI003CF7898D